MDFQAKKMLIRMDASYADVLDFLHYHPKA